jgi:hypothetical protein
MSSDRERHTIIGVLAALLWKLHRIDNQAGRKGKLKISVGEEWDTEKGLL